MTEPGDRSGRPSPIEPAALLRHARLNSLDYPPLVSSGDPLSSEEAVRFLNMLPKRTEADFRRAVSAAYFALFHAVTLRAAALLAPERIRRDQYRFARRFTHRDLRTVAMWITGDGTPAENWTATVEKLRDDGTIPKLAGDFLVLREERTQADYNHLTRFSQGRALAAIRTATEAVRTVTSHSFATSDAGQSFLSIVAAQARPLP